MSSGDIGIQETTTQTHTIAGAIETTEIHMSPLPFPHLYNTTTDAKIHLLYLTDFLLSPGNMLLFSLRCHDLMDLEWSPLMPDLQSKTVCRSLGGALSF